MGQTNFDLKENVQFNMPAEGSLSFALRRSAVVFRSFIVIVFTNIAFLLTITIVFYPHLIDLGKIIGTLFSIMVLLFFYSLFSTKTYRMDYGFWAGQIVKRYFDLLFSSFALFVFMPMIILIVVLIKLDSRGPILHRQRRIGQFRRDIYIFKFRTKYAYASTGDINTSVNKQFTRIGRILRRLYLDEFPQYLNIIQGDMSVVGPRPELPSQIKSYSQDEVRRFNVKPGLTGLAQISLDYKDLNQVLELDLRYVDQWSIVLDIKILLKTVIVVLQRERIWF